MAKNSLFAEPRFQNDEAARAMLESILWPEGPVCPRCGVVNHAYKTKRPGVFRCAEKGCRKDFASHPTNRLRSRVVHGAPYPRGNAPWGLSGSHGQRWQAG
jgi:hypothetical protein